MLKDSTLQSSSAKQSKTTAFTLKSTRTPKPLNVPSLNLLKRSLERKNQPHAEYFDPSLSFSKLNTSAPNYKTEIPVKVLKKSSSQKILHIRPNFGVMLGNKFQRELHRRSNLQEDKTNLQKVTLANSYIRLSSAIKKSRPNKSQGL